MTIMLLLDVPIRPAPRGRCIRRGRPHFDKDYKDRQAASKKALNTALERYAQGKHVPLSGPIGLLAIFLRERPKKPTTEVIRGDYDNYAKALDFCNGILWEDDRQIVDARIIKRYNDPGKPGQLILCVWRVRAWRPTVWLWNSLRVLSVLAQMLTPSTTMDTPIASRVDTMLEQTRKRLRRVFNRSRNT